MHYENSMPIKYKVTIKKENYLIFPMQNVYLPTQMIFMLHKVLYINM